jgi:hypothetical protein
MKRYQGTMKGREKEGREEGRKGGREEGKKENILLLVNCCEGQKSRQNCILC